MRKSDLLGHFFFHYTYYFIILLCLLWIIHAVLYWKSKDLKVSRLIKSTKFELLIPWLLVAFIALTVEPYFNVPTLEMCGLGVAKSMFLERTIQWRHDLIAPGELERMPYWFLVDYKPALFPFLLHLLHRLLGYSSANVFLLNLIIAGLFLSTVYLGARQWVGRMLACSILLLILSGPVFTLCARTAGSDLFSALLLGFTFILLYDFMKYRTGSSFGFLWTTLMLLAYAREENFIYMIMIVLLLIIFKNYISLKLLREHWMIILTTPLLLSPIVWLRIFKIGAYTHLLGDAPLMSPVYFKRNLWQFMSNQLNFSLELPYNTMMHWIAALILLWLFLNMFIRKLILKGTFQKHYVLIIALCLMAYHGLIFLWHYSNSYTDPIAIRLFLIFSVLCALSPLFFLVHYPLLQHRLAKPIFICALFLLMIHHPLAAKGEFIKGHLYCQEADRIREFLKSFEPDKTLVIMPASPRILDLDFPAIEFSSANKYSSFFLGQLKNKKYQEIIVIQRLPHNPRAKPRYPKDDIGPAYQLQTIMDVQITPNLFNRFSRVVIPKS